MRKILNPLSFRPQPQIVTEDRGYDFHQSVGHGSGFGQNGQDDQDFDDFIGFHVKN